MPAVRLGILVSISWMFAACGGPAIPSGLSVGLTGVATTGGGVFDTEIDPTVGIPGTGSGTDPRTESSTSTTMSADSTGSGTVNPGTSDGVDTDPATDSSSGGNGDCEPQLAEVLYDVSGEDDTLEWIRVYNPCAGAVDLSGYSLGWGGVAYTYGTLDLEGQLGAGECMTIGGPTSSVANGSPSFGQAIDLFPDLQNSGTLADGVGLFSVRAGSIGGTTPIDAVIYGQDNDSGLVGPDGSAPMPHVGDAPADQSLRRTGLTRWGMGVPTPDLCPPY
ncbi:MAG: hypothetical protein K0V04_05290 [Deltaproteobacteria bacterium]|nr:hypothetical protein [Deltaproteobacteria bacterium]